MLLKGGFEWGEGGGAQTGFFEGGMGGSGHLYGELWGEEERMECILHLPLYSYPMYEYTFHLISLGGAFCDIGNGGINVNSKQFQT